MDRLGEEIRQPLPFADTSMNNIGLFLDRDGTINEEVDFLTNPDELHLIKGSDSAIREANRLGLKVFIITNQSGVARGLLTEERLNAIHRTLLTMLNKRDAHIDALYYCPHHPELGKPPYNIDCDCRKPRIGMLKRAEREFGIDLRKSFVIGDRLIDVHTAHAAGATSILVLTGYGREDWEICKIHHVPVDHVAENLEAAMRFVKESLVQSESHPR
jgi:D-glycero-D-manno-heptose 1,7-bisphosphate phosphatase